METIMTGVKKYIDIYIIFGGFHLQLYSSPSPCNYMRVGLQLYLSITLLA